MGSSLTCKASMRPLGFVVALAVAFAQALALAALPRDALADDSLRCGSRIVQAGTPAADVAAACGEPVYRDVWLMPRPGRGFVSDDEEWYYNFGRTQLLRVLHFHHGNLADVGSDGYGYDAPPAHDCGPSDLVEGMTKFRLLLRCGEPASRSTVNVQEPLRRRDGSVVPGYFEEVFRERWVYNFGSNYLLHIVTLRNGRVTDVTTGDRGTAK